jgi:diguanylate cyclase (GGDEF)-like protein/PAS domain S-box-containing protein
MSAYNFVTAEIISSKACDKAVLPSIAMNEAAGSTPDELPLFDPGSPFLERLEMQLKMQIQELSLSNERLQEEVEEYKRAEEVLRLAAAAFESHEAVVITDAQAHIIRVNQAFSDITGYLPEEVTGKNPRIMSSGKHGPEFYADMWRRLLAEGKWSGEIWDKRKNGEIYPKWTSITAVKNTRGEIGNYVAIFSDITSRKKAEEEIRYLAFYDALTHLPNRRLFLDRLGTALSASARRNDYGAIMFVDLDHFKTLNDTHGHDCGDLVLKEMGDRIKSCIRQIDIAARFGGDEFVILIEAVSNERGDAARRVALVAEKIREALVQPCKIGEQEHRCSSSIGIRLFHGNEHPADVLIKHADMAMYQAKMSKRNSVRFFDDVA